MMLVRRFGSRLHRVTPNFDANAMTEISFQRGSALDDPAEEVLAGMERVAEHVLTAQAEGDVHTEAEQQVLRSLEDRLRALESELADGEMLLIESEPGVDYPKTRNRQRTDVIEGENRLHFRIEVDPPLRVGHYRPRA